MGNWNHQPNYDAVEWMCTEIWPRFQELYPMAKFHVVGANYGVLNTIPGSCLGNKNIVNHREVNDLYSMFNSVRLSVAPLRYGAGVKGKVNSSMRYGVPVVVTEIAIEGMHVQDGENAMVASSMHDFVASMARVYGNELLWSQLRTGGFENLDHWFSSERAKQTLQNALSPLYYNSREALISSR